MTRLIGASLALATAFTLAVPTATAELRGFVDASVANQQVDTPLGETDDTGYAFGGSLRGRLGETLNIQGDLRYVGNDDADTFGPTLQLYGLITPSVVLGGHVGYLSADDADTLGGGVSLATRMDRILLGARGEVFTIDDTETDGFALRGAGRFYPAENLMLGGVAGWTRTTTEVLGTELDLDAWNFGVEGEYGFSAAPVSLFAGLGYEDISDVEVSSTTARIGLRLHFGNGSLLDRQTQGPLFGAFGGQGVFAQGGLDQ
jgi:hypothetical protein